MVISIPLSGKKYPGLFALVDDEDYASASAFKWRSRGVVRKDGSILTYAVRTINCKVDGRKFAKIQGLHQFIVSGYTMIDHIDGDGLNNQRHNIRPATNSLNQANRKTLSPSASSRFRGVTLHKRLGLWQAAIKVNQKNFYLGVFHNERDAARAYNEAALIHFGEFASLNEIGAAA